MLVTTTEHKPTSQKCFGKKLIDLNLNWKETYMTPRIVSKKTYMRCFHYKCGKSSISIFHLFFPSIDKVFILGVRLYTRL